MSAHAEGPQGRCEVGEALIRRPARAHRLPGRHLQAVDGQHRAMPANARGPGRQCLLLQPLSR
eukprot:8938402-Alexandrium_andersonii.AAC.1